MFCYVLLLSLPCQIAMLLCLPLVAVDSFLMINQSTSVLNTLESESGSHVGSPILRETNGLG